MNQNENADHQELWGDEQLPNLDTVFRGTLGYASTPGWALIHRRITETIGSFDGLNSVELGCGEGKISILFSLIGANTTLLDYSENQIRAAKYVHSNFETGSKIIQGNLLQLSSDLVGQYDVSMSFGTAEHFFGDERQKSL